MSKKNNQLIFVLAVIIAAVLVLPGCKKRPVEQAQTGNDNEISLPAPVVEKPPKNVKPEVAVPAGPKKIHLTDVIKAARKWRPAYTHWVGETALDFTLTDINGKQHKLSDYRGKDVLITFWATWCSPCKVEVPHLVALRNLISEDKLAILAISYTSILPRETPEKVKAFVKQNKINYTVFSVDRRTMPTPFRRITGIPCSFFIDPQGRIKLATEGLVSLGETKAILQAE
jgi:peroxiredoxin